MKKIYVWVVSTQSSRYLCGDDQNAATHFSSPRTFFVETKTKSALEAVKVAQKHLRRAKVARTVTGLQYHGLIFR